MHRTDLSVLLSVSPEIKGQGWIDEMLYVLNRLAM